MSGVIVSVGNYIALCRQPAHVSHCEWSHHQLCHIEPLPNTRICLVVKIHQRLDENLTRTTYNERLSDLRMRDSMLFLGVILSKPWAGQKC